MNVPPKKLDLFKWKKAARRLSDWMRQRGLSPLEDGIINQELPRLVAPPPHQSKREQARQAMWERVARKASRRQLKSVEFDKSSDASLTRTIVSSVMTASRGITDNEVDDMEKELERDMTSGPIDDIPGVEQLLTLSERETLSAPIPTIDLRDLNAVFEFLMT